MFGLIASTPVQTTMKDMSANKDYSVVDIVALSKEVGLCVFVSLFASLFVCLFDMFVGFFFFVCTCIWSIYLLCSLFIEFSITSHTHTHAHI